MQRPLSKDPARDDHALADVLCWEGGGPAVNAGGTFWYIIGPCGSSGHGGRCSSVCLCRCVPPPGARTGDGQDNGVSRLAGGGGRGGAGQGQTRGVSVRDSDRGDGFPRQRSALGGRGGFARSQPPPVTTLYTAPALLGSSRLFTFRPAGTAPFGAPVLCILQSPQRALFVIRILELSPALCCTQSLWAASKVRRRRCSRERQRPVAPHVHLWCEREGASPFFWGLGGGACLGPEPCSRWSAARSTGQGALSG